MAFTISGTTIQVSGTETGASFHTWAATNTVAARQLAPKAVEAIYTLRIQNGAVFDTSDIVLVINERVMSQADANTDSGIHRCKGGLVLVQGTVNQWADNGAIPDYENAQFLIQKTGGAQGFFPFNQRATLGVIKKSKYIVKTGFIDAHLMLTTGAGTISDVTLQNDAAAAGIIAMRNQDTDGVGLYRIDPFGWPGEVTSFHKNMTMYNASADEIRHSYRRFNGGAIWYNCRNFVTGNRMTAHRYVDNIGGGEDARSVIVGAYKPTLQSALGVALSGVEVSIIKTSDNSVEQAGSTGANGQINIATTASTDNRLLSYNNSFVSGSVTYSRKIAEAGVKYIKQSITPAISGNNVVSVDQGTFKIVQRRADLLEITATQSFATDYDGFKTMFADAAFTGTVGQAAAITGVAFAVASGLVTVTVTGAVTPQQIYNYWKHWSSLTAQMGIDQQLIRLVSGDLKITGSLTTSAVITSVATAPTITATGTVSITGAGAITGTYTDSAGTRVNITEITGRAISTYVTINGTAIGGSTVNSVFVPGWVSFATTRTITVQPTDNVRIVAGYWGSKPLLVNCLGSEIAKFTLAFEAEPGVDTTISTVTRDAIANSILTVVNGATGNIEGTINQTLAAYTPNEVISAIAYDTVATSYQVFAACSSANSVNIYSISSGKLVFYAPNYKLRMADTAVGGAAITPNAAGYSVPIVTYYFDVATGVASPITLLNASGAKIETAPWTQATATLSDGDKTSIAEKTKAQIEGSTVVAKEATVTSRASQTSVNTVQTDVAAVPASVWAQPVETGLNATATMRLMSAVLLGKVSGAGTGTETFRDVNDTKNRVVSSVDAQGNRTSVVRDGA